jgi:hypothetical protein
MTDRELLKQALRALEDFDKHTKGVMIPSTRNQGSDAITAIRAHLDTPEQYGYISGGVKELGDFHPLQYNTKDVEPVAKCTESDQWNCKYCNKTKTCAALADPRNHGTPIAPGWLRAVDEAMVGSHLGVADASDSYEVAKKKLNDLICWNIQVATDPAVNGGMVLVPKKLIEGIEARRAARGFYMGEDCIDLIAAAKGE